MYCVYYNDVKIGEGKSKDWACDLISMFRPPVGTTVKVTKEDVLFEYEVMKNES